MERTEKQPPSSLSSSYQAFIAENLESLNRHHRISKLNRRRIRACFHGWVILSDHLPDSVLLCLWNPLIPKLIRLPPLLDKEKAPKHFCLSSPPDSPGSVFIFTIPKDPTIVFCQLDGEKVGLELEWTEMSYAKQLTSIGGVCIDGCFLEFLTCCNGKVYALTLVYSMTVGASYDAIVVQVDIVVKGKDVVISLVPFVKLPKIYYGSCPIPRSYSLIYPFFIGSGTKLFYLELSYAYESRTGDVHLFSLDMDSMMWEELEDLKDDVIVLLLDDGSGTKNLAFYKSKVFSDIAGYVHVLSDREAVVSSFHVKDRTLSLSVMPSFVRESQLLVWTMLECGLEANHPKSKQEEENKGKDIVLRPVKGDETESDITTSESHLLDIPFHILESIMKLCVGVEYMKFRATCKRCSLAAPLIQWSSKTTLRRLQTYSLASPWLMVFNNYEDIITFIDPLYGDKYVIKTSQELKGYRIYCSRFGWLLMYKDPRHLVFFNPFTSDKRELPMIDPVESFCFSAPPTSPNSMVVGFTTLLPCYVYIHFVHAESFWRRYQLNLGSNHPRSIQFPTFSGRDIYALCNDVRINAFRDIDDEGYSLDVVVDKAPRSCCRYRAQYFLSNCDQHTLLVIVGEFGEFVEVFKLNHSTKEWEKLGSLGKHMVYISDTSCICLEAKSPEMENKIYIPRLLHGENTKIVFYSLETCRYHTIDEKIIQKSLGANLFLGKQHCLHHTWIEPSWA